MSQSPSPPRGLARPQTTLLGALALIYGLLAATNPMDSTVHGDGYYTYLWARSLVFDGDVSFASDYAICPDPWNLARTPVGDNVNYWNLGPALFWVPILAVERLIGLQSTNAQERVGCTGPLAERAVYGSMIAGLLAAWVGFLLARRHVIPAAAWAGAFLGATLTPLLYYATTMLSYGHAASSFACGLLLLVWDQRRTVADGRKDLRSWALVGAALGFAMLMRAQNAIFVIFPLSTWLCGAWNLRRSARALSIHAAQGFLFLFTMLALFSPQMYSWWSQIGSPLGISQGEHYIRWGSPQIARALFSTSAGLFVYSPAFYAAFIGWILLALKRRSRALGIGCLVVFALDAYVVGAAYDWWASVGYPGRRFDALFVPSMLGIAAVAAWCIDRMRRSNGLIPFLLIVLVGLGPFAVAMNRGIARYIRLDLAGPANRKWDALSAGLHRDLWREVGNPLAWPASIPFALRWGVHPRDWDVLGGQDLFYHDHQTLVRRERESTLYINDTVNDGYFGGSFFSEIGNFGGHNVRFADPGSARILLPLHWPDLGGIRFEIYGSPEQQAKLSLQINGIYAGTKRLDEGDLGESAVVEFRIPAGASRHGINEIWLTIEGSALGFVQLELLDVDPPPSIEQARRNRQHRASVTAR